MSLFRRKKKEDISCIEEGKIKNARQEIKIGLFLAVGLSILALFIFVVGDFGTLFREKGYVLYAQFDSVAGLEKRTVVRLAGVKVGYVKDIRLKGSQAEVEMSLDPHVEINKGSKATLASLGLLGEKYVEILPGEGESAILPGGVIGSIPPVSFDQLGIMLSSIGEEIQSTSQTLRELIGGDETQTDLKETLHNLSVFSAELSDFFSENKTSVVRSLEKSTQAIQEFNQNAQQVSKDVDDLILLIRDTVEENRGSLKENFERIKKLIDKIEQSLTHLNDSLEKLNEGKGTLGKLIQEPELYEKTEKTVDQIHEIVTPVSSMRLNLRLQAEYFGESDLLRSAFSFGFWPTQNKFLLGQLIHDPWEDRFTYSLQGGIRWGAIAPRAGIMESEFGVGIDTYILEDKLIFSLEGFDFNRNPRPRFRMWTRYAASPFIHLLIGLEDFTLASDREVYFGLSVGF